MGYGGFMNLVMGWGPTVSCQSLADLNESKGFCFSQQNKMVPSESLIAYESSHPFSLHETSFSHR